MPIQLGAISIVLFVMIFTKASSNTIDVSTAAIGSLITSIAISTFLWSAIKKAEIMKQDGRHPSIWSVITNTNISKYSLIGIEL